MARIISPDKFDRYGLTANRSVPLPRFDPLNAYRRSSWAFTKIPPNLHLASIDLFTFRRRVGLFSRVPAELGDIVNISRLARLAASRFPTSRIPAMAANSEPQGSRAFLALVLALIACPAAFSQQITCPVASNFVNTAVVSNSLNPCVIASGVTFSNLGDSANLTNSSGATLLNDSGATFTNEVSAGLINNGTLTNNGRIVDDGTIINGGTLAGGTLTNGGTLEIQPDGMLTNGGTPTGATINNNAGAMLTSFGQVTNAENGTINSAGTITNAGTFTNFLGTITNFLGTINNLGTFNNSGTLTNFIGTIDNVATFNNGGTLNNIIGTVTTFATFNTTPGGTNTGTLN